MATRYKLSSKQSLMLLGVVALAGVCFELYSASKAIAARNWRSVSGTVTESRFERRYSGHNRHRSSQLRFRYSYSYGGESYTGSRLNFGGISQYFRFFGYEASGTTEKYPQGAQVTIYVNPDSPADAVIEREFPMSATIVLGLGVTILVTMAGAHFLDLNS